MVRCYKALVWHYTALLTFDYVSFPFFVATILKLVWELLGDLGGLGLKLLGNCSETLGEIVLHLFDTFSELITT